MYNTLVVKLVDTKNCTISKTMLYYCTMSFCKIGTLLKLKVGKLQNFKKLKKHNTGNYYGWFFNKGKQVKKSFKSSDKKVTIKY